MKKELERGITITHVGKPKETIEKAKNNYVYDKYKQSLDDVVGNAIMFGAKWQQERLCDSEVIQRIRASKSDAEARRIIKTIKKEII